MLAAPTGRRHGMDARIARELGLEQAGVAAVLALLDEGATVPFIARYRKERTGGLDEVQIRDIAERATGLAELDKRREVVLAQIREQGALTPELERRIRAAATRTELEDLYLPFRPKRKTRASVARERGLAPLAEQILAQPRGGHPAQAARRFVDPGREVPDVDAALAGARDIAAEVVCERADVRSLARDAFAQHGRVASKAIKKAVGDQRTRFEDYYDYAERGERVPSHRYLAVCRGEAEGFLRVHLELDDERLVGQILRVAGHDRRSPWGDELAAAVQDGYARLLRPAVEKDVRGTLKERADAEAVAVFAKNLESLLLAAPLGERPVVGVDPGFRTGCKCTALTATGELVAHTTIHPHTSKDTARAARELVALVERVGAAAVAVGNGTAGRETEDFVRGALRDAGRGEVLVVSVNEAGASVYSASDVAREEFPDLDLTYRGAISIGRRLQDPLAELVKIEPKALGVGQYQHDVHQPLLGERLGQVVETAVNRVGVDVNTASAQLLAYVAGLGAAVARAVVAHRAARGRFTSRRQLLEVSGLGPKRFEQAAGFLRVRGGQHPLDASAVHPERYALVERIARDARTRLEELVGDAARVGRLDLSRYVGGEVGEPTLRDIADELARPGRDPREAFEAPSFREDVRTPEDLEPGMVLDGVVTNVTNFGAFVDIGVHQDGLVHISELSDRFVRDPHQVAHAGQRMRVRVLSVDLKRRRIALSAKLSG
ncbi:MAG: RNA-binding transcriptional accessory protein [Deltaproteobacteria bacterium]|nr:MAG: RNA-binding transcriptional accessory protein [Deltaproteobacteria bacterium]